MIQNFVAPQCTTYVPYSCNGDDGSNHDAVIQKPTCFHIVRCLIRPISQDG